VIGGFLRPSSEDRQDPASFLREPPRYRRLHHRLGRVGRQKTGGWSGHPASRRL